MISATTPFNRVLIICMSFALMSVVIVLRYEFLLYIYSLFCYLSIWHFRFSTSFVIFSLSFSSCNSFSRHEINQINLVNASKHQSMQILHNLLSQLPSSSHTSNVTNHFNNQTSAHAGYSNAQLTRGLTNKANSNASVDTFIRNLPDEQFAMRFDNELRHRQFSSSAEINRYYRGPRCWCGRATCNHRPTTILLMFSAVAHFMGKYHVLSHAVVGVIFYLVLFYLIFTWSKPSQKQQCNSWPLYPFPNTWTECGVSNIVTLYRLNLFGRFNYY